MHVLSAAGMAQFTSVPCSMRVGAPVLAPFHTMVRPLLVTGYHVTTRSGTAAFTRSQACKLRAKLASGD
jgi:hypothetical protein